MTTRFESITHLISDADLHVLMDCAVSSTHLQGLWDKAQERLSAPSAASRRNALKTFRSWYLDGLNPAAEPAVLAWYAFPDSQIRREVLHVERCRHLALLDSFLSEELYPQLGHGQLSLFGDEIIGVTSAEIDSFVVDRLPALSKRTRHVTRDKLRSLLVAAGLVQRTGTDFVGTWRYTYYRPAWQAWLYGLYREFEDTGHRERAERYVAEESRLTRRFLLRSAEVSSLLAEGARRGALEFENFAGERYVRLQYSDVATLVRALGNTGIGRE